MAQINLTALSPSIQQLPAISISQSSKTLLQHMQSVFMESESEHTKSLHERTLSLPFYQHLLHSKDISADRLVLHFVNNSAIFNKIEILIKTHQSFQEIFGEDIFRYEEIEKDIAFFITQFNLKRPETTEATKNFLRFIDQTAKENPPLLLAIFYVQYSGLFLGRLVCGATSDWLRNKVKNWDSLSQADKGISYWNFKDLPEFKDREDRKTKLLNAINQLGKKLARVDWDLLQETARRAFEHNFQCIQSVTSSKADFSKSNNPYCMIESSSIRKIAAGSLLLIALTFLLQQFIASNQEFVREQ